VKNEFQNLLRNFVDCLTTSEQAKLQYDESWTALIKAGSALSDYIRKNRMYDGAELPPQGPYQVIYNGQTRYRAEKDIEDLRSSSDAHLILDVPRMKLGYVKKGKKGEGKIWVSINWSIYRVLLVGLSHPGDYFGNLTVKRFFDMGKLTARTLARYVSEVTKLIQDGGTNGPYIWHASGIYDESDTGYTYLFDERFDYVVVKKIKKR
jgi:hypothetical protein